MAKRPVPRYDFKAFGAAIKAAREGCKESRKKVGDEMFISPRYLANIENKGQHPSLQIFFELIQRYHISVDQFLLETPKGGRSDERSRRRGDQLHRRRLHVESRTFTGSAFSYSCCSYSDQSGQDPRSVAGCWGVDHAWPSP